MDLHAILNHGDEIHQNKPSLLSLPVELYTPIFSHLPNRDIKNIRLTCTFFHAIARLRLERVFISANPYNIQILRAIADSETFRQGVTEIVWDDARLATSLHLATAYNEDEFNWEAISDDEDEKNPDCPSWFARICDDNADNLKSRKGLDADRPEHRAREQQLAAQLPPAVCWAHYQELLAQQEAVLAIGSDEDAFRYALQRFPALRRVTVTPAAHGLLFSPVYETPMIRALPYGFNYPIPHGWPTGPDDVPAVRAHPWPITEDDDHDDYKARWRGVIIALRVLAEQPAADSTPTSTRPSAPHNITELVFDAHQLNTGLNSRIFQDPATSPEYAHLSAILRRPGFARLDLALIVGWQEHEGWPALRSGHLRRMLAGAPDLRHVSLRTNVGRDPDAQAAVWGSGGSAAHHVPLRSVFPIEAWAGLRHLGLSGFLVTRDDVVALLGAMPALRSVELSFLYFLDNGGDYRGLLEGIRDELGWREREVVDRPRVVIGHSLIVPVVGRAVWVDREVDEFLYGDGVNPFGRDDGFAPDQVWMGRAGVERDAFDPSHERPYVDGFALMRMGIYAKAP